MGIMRSAAIAFGTIGLASAAAAHLAWGRGSSWPMRTREELADVVVGSQQVPAAGECYAVAALTAAGAALVTGMGGGGKLATGARWTLAAVLGSRGVVGGRAACSALRLPTPSDRFVELDNTVYRPLCLAIAGAAAISARR